MQIDETMQLGADNAAPQMHHDRSHTPGQYAGFWRRVAANSLDGLLLFPVLLLVGGGTSYLVLLVADPNPTSIWPVLLSSFVSTATVSWLYFASAHSSPRQATWGKKVIGIKVVDVQGGRIGFARATGRHFANRLASIPTFGLVHLMVAFTAKRQGLHDIAAGTLVVANEPMPQAVGQGLAAPRPTRRDFALAALALVPPAFVLLTAPALQSFQDDTIRAQAQSGLELAAVAKSLINRAYVDGVPLSEISSQSLGLAPETMKGAYVAGIWIESGAIAVEYGEKAAPALQGTNIFITPIIKTPASLEWRCDTELPPDAAPTPRPDTQPPAVPARYLPDECK